MSLDVYLRLHKAVEDAPRQERIFIREGGSTKEITRREWDDRFPGREPVVAVTGCEGDDGEVYWRNITHNLGRMARTAGIYEHMWRPDEIGITKAAELIKPLTDGLATLQSDPLKFKADNPENGWGDYDGLVEFVADYLGACMNYPTAEVHVDR